MNRRKALLKLGLAVATIYIAPSLITLSGKAHANGGSSGSSGSIGSISSIGSSSSSGGGGGSPSSPSVNGSSGPSDHCDRPSFVIRPQCGVR